MIAPYEIENVKRVVETIMKQYPELGFIIYEKRNLENYEQRTKPIILRGEK